LRKKETDPAPSTLTTTVPLLLRMARGKRGSNMGVVAKMIQKANDA